MTTPTLRIAVATALMVAAWFGAPHTSFFVFVCALTLMIGGSLLIVPPPYRLSFVKAPAAVGIASYIWPLVRA